MLTFKDLDEVGDAAAPLIMSLYPSVKSRSVAPAVDSKLLRPHKVRRCARSTHRASVRIQRNWRRYASVKNDVDPSTQEPVHRGDRYFLLVESQFISYKFDGPAFAASVLCSGVFEHPILRRVLLLPEVRRLGRAAGFNAFGREALLISFHCSAQITQYSSTRSSLLSFLEDEAGSALNTALEKAEFFEYLNVENQYDDGVSDYANCLNEIILARPEAVSTLVSIHKNIVESRSRCIWRETQEDLLDTMNDAKCEADSRMRRALRSGRERSLTALGEWIRV